MFHCACPKPHKDNKLGSKFSRNSAHFATTPTQVPRLPPLSYEGGRVIGCDARSGQRGRLPLPRLSHTRADKHDRNQTFTATTSSRRCSYSGSDSSLPLKKNALWPTTQGGTTTYHHLSVVDLSCSLLTEQTDKYGAQKRQLQTKGLGGGGNHTPSHLKAHKPRRLLRPGLSQH